MVTLIQPGRRILALARDRRWRICDEQVSPRTPTHVVLAHGGFVSARRICVPRERVSPLAQSRNETTSHALERRQIKLILRLLRDNAQIRPQRRFGDCLGIVASFFWPLEKGIT